MDAIDAALVEFDTQTLRVVHYQQFPIAVEIQATIRAANSTLSIKDLTRLDVIMGELFAAAVLELLESAKVDRQAITAIGSHGQTILHLPESDYPRTLQIGDPGIIAAKSGITTVADFRRNDIAAGGQGAPLAPAFHAWRFRSHDTTRVVLNLGGMANITILPTDENQDIIGFDTGPGNNLMDAWSQQHINKSYDIDGHWAAEGSCNKELLDNLMNHPYIALAPPKSTGKDDFNLPWLVEQLGALNMNISDADVQRTLLELSAQSISAAIDLHGQDASELLVCGGGVHNPLLMQRLSVLLPKLEIVSTERYGIHPDAVEAIAFAWLAKCRLDKVPGNIPSVTGAERPVMLGAIYEA